MSSDHKSDTNKSDNDEVIAENTDDQKQKNTQKECENSVENDPKTAKAEEKPRKSLIITPEKYTFFYGIKSPFSQFHPAKFTIDGVIYSCAEQYMMHQKAVTFKDDKMAREILKTTCPKTMKKHGRKVSNFNKDVWSAKCKTVVKKASVAKYSQNAELKAELLKTAGTVLVECSPRDRLWGIGMGASNPKAKHKASWRGKNWLGYVLTEVRDELLKQEKQ